MDNLAYTYTSGKNQLATISDAITSNNYVDNEIPAGIYNFTYNDIGQMISDGSEGYSITYNSMGLVANIKNTNNNNTLVSYAYDQAGNRLRKRSYNNSGVPVTNTYYVRDAAGTVMSIYEQDIITSTTTQTELPVYGMGTIGIIKTGISSGNRTKLKDLYSLSDHLGNIRLVLEDRLNAFGQPVVAQYADYYPFGSLMPGRSLNPSNYRYSYQNQEKDNETGYHNFELRQYASLLGRWMTPDPYGQHYSPYLAMSNNPVSFIDPDGGWDGSPDGGWDGSAVDDGGGDRIKRHNEAVANRATQQMNEAYTQWLGEMNNGNVPWYGLSGSMGGYTAGNKQTDWSDMLKESYYIYNDNKNIKALDEWNRYIKSVCWDYDKERKGLGGEIDMFKITFSEYRDFGAPTYAQGGGGGWDATSKVLNGLGFGAGVKDMIIEGGAALNRGTKIWNVNNTSVLRSYGAAGAKYLKLSKGLGVAGSVVTTLYSGSKVLDQITTPGGINNVKTRDVFDTVIGAAGVGAFFFMSSNPIGWGVGAGVLLYGAGTMIHDIYQEKNKK